MVSKPSVPSQLAFERHREACLQGESGYFDPESGFFVLSSVALLQQDECCGNGCRHCPYSEEEQERAERPEVPAYPLLP